MKKIHLYMAGAALMALTAACSEEQFNVDGEGQLVLRASVNSDMTVVSRATEDELAENCMVWISSEKGLVRRYNSLSEVPSEPIDLVTGHYVAEAWTGDSVSASFDKRWFKGREEFDVAAGQTAQVDLVCRIANVAASVKYAEGLEEVLTDFTMTVGHDRGSLVFEGRDDRRGYFMMPSIDKNLAFELRGTQINGTEFVYNGVIEDAQPATEYVLNVKFTQQTNAVGGAVFSIEIDEHTIDVETNIELIAAPKMEGYGFDLASTVMGEPGAIGRRTVYISTASTLKTVELRSDLLLGITELGGNDCELLAMEPDGVGVNALANAGINFKLTPSEAGELFQLNFEESFTNELTEGDYTIDVTATDINGKASTAVLAITVSDAAVMTAPATEVSYFSATLHANLVKETEAALGFNYRAAGAQEWNHVDAVANGSDITAELTGLKDNADYEYTVTAGAFTSAVIEKFTTLSAQLPNNSFEEWGMYGKSNILGVDYSSVFWDSGNHGATTLGASYNLTTASTTYVHSGNYSARLESKYIVIKFAAGNLFVGKYLKTNGTNGVLGWGRPFTLTPKALKAWVKYEPATAVNGKGTGSYIKAGDLDQGIMYVALVDDTKSSYNGEEWPIIVDTSDQENKLFKKDADNVIAYGEHVFTEPTEGNNLIQIEIPIEYFKPGVTPSNIVLVASASRYGDYFQGAAGSVLYVDDIELVY